MTQQRRRVLGDRYEIEAVLGQGGMAKVFRGTDRVLGRTVAVKVLSPQFAGDAQFVARFRREAKAAAALNHHNIVSVFDTGSQSDVHYIVMEYIEGRTLRDIIRSEGPLLPERAAEITGEVAKALASAHEAGMVHRDIKPGNIMITKEGEVKVMDFGIARTSTGDTLTQTAAVLGTAAYLSPEQAQGQPVDLRSDIYSLGCVMYEMLTGQPPFTGDSPVAIAYKHVRENPVPPSRSNRDVPASMESVVMKMMAKNPANRYQTADELRQDLDRVRQGLPTLATPLLPGDATELLTGGEDRTAVMTEAPPEEEERRRRWVPVLVTLLVLAALALAAFFLIRALLGGGETVRMPDVIGQPQQSAIRELRGLGLEVKVEEAFNRDFERGDVFDQQPQSGDLVEVGSEVTISVSRGIRQTTVPNVVGLSREEAEAALTDANLQVGSVTEQAADAASGTVIDQSPEADDRVPRGTAVNLVISSGPATVAVPNVKCQDPDSAREEIEGAGLQYQEGGDQFSTECGAETGVVIDQNPSAGTQVAPDSTVTVTISSGPSPTPTETETETP